MVLWKLARGRECVPKKAEQECGDETLDKIIVQLRREGFVINDRPGCRVVPGVRVMRFRCYWLVPSKKNLRRSVEFLTARGWRLYREWMD
jgi:hypothetical protein